MNNPQYNFTVTQLDLDFILKQIKIAEASTNPITGAAENLPNLVGSPLLPYGLRTVDGTWNSLLPGMERLGAADNIMPRLVAANLKTAEARPAGFFGPSDPGSATPTSYAQNSGNVFDTQPRVSSNLIVDQTITNPAAVAAALRVAGSASPVADAQTLINANNVAKAAAVTLATATANANAANAALALLQTGSGATAQALITAQANNTAAQAALVIAQAELVAAQDAGATALLEFNAAQAGVDNAAAVLAQSTQTLAQANQLAASTAITASTNSNAAQAAFILSNAANAEALTANSAKATALAAYTAAVNTASGAAATAPAVIAAQNVLNDANTNATNADTAATLAQNAYLTAAGDAAAAASLANTAASAQAAAQINFNAAQLANTNAQAAYAIETTQYGAAQSASTDASDALLTANNNLAAAKLAVTTTAAQLASDIANFGAGSTQAIASKTLADAAVVTKNSAQTALTTAATQYLSAQNALGVAEAEYLGAQTQAATALTALNDATGNLTNTTNAATAANAARTQLDAFAATALSAANNADAQAVSAHNAQATALSDYNSAISSFVAGDPNVALASTNYNDAIAAVNAKNTIASNALDAYTLASTIAAGSTQAAQSAATALTNANNANEAALAQVSATQAILTTETAQNAAAQALVATEQIEFSTANANATSASSALTAAQTAASQGNAGLAAALTAANDADAAKAAAQLLSTNTKHDFDVLAENLGLEISVNGTITIENRSPDIGLSPSFNGWMTFFGQFFDHGLDLVTKGNSGTVFVPLLPDDPLYVAGSNSNFMVLTRAQNLPGADGIIGTADDIHDNINTTTPFIDQNQTYTSHPSHQVFLREYHMVDGKPLATGSLLNGAHGEGNWGEVKAQAAQMLGIQLVDMDVHNGPLLATDRYGEFLRGPHGFAQIVTVNGLVEGDPTANGGKGILLPANTIRTDHAFLNDIAHGAAPGFFDHDHNPATAKIALVADSDNIINGQPNPNFDPTQPISTTNTLLIEQPFGTYDNEMLDRHFITGDGRGNENIGLTAVHAVFHSEHNRLVEAYKHTILASGDLATINEWLLTDLTSLNQVPTNDAAIKALNWDGERLFQAGRFVTEMQYQHLVFEEFARTVQPAIDPFIFSNSADINPAITAEFAHVVYRFGHSMLNETVARTDINNVSSDVGLIQAFLNPIEFDRGGVTEHQAIGSIVRGMTQQVGNEIDEFVTEALRNNLVGLPLDLATLNMARARETGMPSFNEARAQFFAMSGQSNLTPYTSWADMAPHLKNAGSIVNFVAAYGTHSSITSEATLAGKRAAAMDLVFGGTDAPADRIDFLNSTGGWTPQNSGLNDVDFWIGGLAEELNQFGGMLGATFNFVFEAQMEKLQNGDRFYYLSRTQGTNMLNELEANSFAALVMRNSDLGSAQSSHLPGHLFQTPNYILEINQSLQVGADPTGTDPVLNALNPLVIRRAVGADVNGDGAGDGGYIKYSGFDHMVLGGTAGNDQIYGGGGIDTVWGDAGDDRIDAGDEADEVHGGDGDDIITDHGTPVGGADFLRGDEGNDVISSGNGNDIVFGGGGNDFIVTGDDFTEVFAGRGDDFVLGGRGPDTLSGNEGNDWIEGGEGFDGLSGENSELFFNSPIIGHDVLNGQGNDTDYDGESGDDIMVEGAGIQRNNGMFGFDWAIHKGDTVNADSDLGIAFFPAQPQFTLRDRFDSVEGLSGWNMNDTLTGAGVLKGAAGGAGAGVGAPIDESNLKSQNVSLINGYAELLGLTTTEVNAMAFNTDIIDITQGAEVIIGGGGNDTIKGNLGNDILDGDAWLNVRISVRANKDGTGAELFSVDSMNEIRARMISGEINPGQLKIVREILQATTGATDEDTAVYNGNQADYTLTKNANGTITVAHTTVRAGVLNDGTDTIRNIELIKFADSTLDLRNVAPVITSNGGGNTAAVAIDENTTAVTRVTATDANVGQVLTYAISGGVDAALFRINANTGALRFINAPDFEAPTDSGGNNVYDVIVQASDGALLDTQAIAVTVRNVLEAPVITSNGGGATANITLPENTLAATTVVAANVNAGSTTAYSISGTDAARFTINATTGVLRFVTAPNFEAPIDVGANNVYQVSVRAQNGALFDTQALSITVANVNEPATGSVKITGYTATANAATLTATNNLADPDGMTAFVPFQWQRQVAGNWVNIAGATSATLANQTDSTIRVTSTYNDPFGANTAISTETVFITANSGNNTRLGTAGNDFILGLGGADVLTGAAGNDVVDGGIGADRLIATVNDGNDTYIGGAGIDSYDLALTTAGATVNLSLGTATSAQTGVDTLTGVENVVGSTGNDVITDSLGINNIDGGIGNNTFVMINDNAADTIRGRTGNDTVDYTALTANLNIALNANNVVNVNGSGTAGNLDNIRGIENVTGGGGNDTLTGDANANRLIGGAGNDTLTGGNGLDTLTGGLGGDNFAFNTINQSGLGVGARDVITDFVSGIDKLNFSGIDADTRATAPGNQAFTFNNTAGAGFTGAGQLIYHYEGTGANEITVVQGNVDANLNADFEVALLGHIAFNAATDITL